MGNMGCIRVNKDLKDWRSAEKECYNQEGSLLVALKTQQQFDYLIQLLQGYSGIKDVWTGGNDLETEGAYKNPGGSAIPSLVWKTGEPNNVEHTGTTGEHCMVLHKHHAWKANDERCTMKYSYICQF